MGCVWNDINTIINRWHPIIFNTTKPISCCFVASLVPSLSLHRGVSGITVVKLDVCSNHHQFCSLQHMNYYFEEIFLPYQLLYHLLIAHCCSCLQRKTLNKNKIRGHGESFTHQEDIADGGMMAMEMMGKFKPPMLWSVWNTYKIIRKVTSSQ